MFFKTFDCCIVRCLRLLRMRRSNSTLVKSNYCIIDTLTIDLFFVHKGRRVAAYQLTSTIAAESCSKIDKMFVSSKNFQLHFKNSKIQTCCSHSLFASNQKTQPSFARLIFENCKTSTQLTKIKNEKLDMIHLIESIK